MLKRLHGLAGSVALALAVAATTLHSVSVNWATGDALGSVAVSFDGQVRIYYDLYGAAPGAAATEDVAVGGTGFGLAYDNALKLFAGNDGAAGAFRIVTLAEASPHASSVAFTTTASARSLVFAGDGTLYAAATGGRITRFQAGASPVTFLVAFDSTDCIGIDLAADQSTLFVVSGGRNIHVLENAHQASGDRVPNTAVFTRLSGSGAACGIRLLPPERGSAERNHGGMLIADRRDIKRVNAAKATIAEFRSSGGGTQGWTDVAVDPRMVFTGITPATGTEPAEYTFWGIDATQRIVARFQTNGGGAPLQAEPTSLAPKGLAINGELRVAQSVRRVALSAAPRTVSFLQGTPYQHSWTARDAGSGDFAVLAYEVRSDGTTDAIPLSGRCAPSLDVDCRFVTHFSSGASTPAAIDYSRGRAVVYRGIPAAGFSEPASGARDEVTITYPSVTKPQPATGCTAAPAVSLLRDPFVSTGHDEFQRDGTKAFYGSDHAVRDGTDVLGGTDYVAVTRADTRFASRLLRPEALVVTSVQSGSSLPISLVITDPSAACAPVGTLENVLVLTATELRPGGVGVPVGDSLTPGSLGTNGLAPWKFAENQWRTNLDLHPSTFVSGRSYEICINAKAVENDRPFGDMCATIAIVKGSGRK